MNGNNFTGKVSIDFGGLPNLWCLVLASNQLGVGIADDLSFLKSLTRCRNLKMLDLSDNHLGGVLPDAIANLSTNLLSLRLGSNKLSGSIPIGIENLVNLTDLQLQTNKLTGRIPTAIGELNMLRLLDMSLNELSEFILLSMSNLTRLYALRLANNYLTGSILPSFGYFQYLQELDLSHNRLDGTIPGGVMGLSSLTVLLNLANNNLSGSLPFEVGALKNLGHLDVSGNTLSGEIPDSRGGCVTVELLHPEGNFFEGSIPPSFCSMRGLQDLDLSRNNLSGQIPAFSALLNFNLSFNHSEGELPTEGVFANATTISVVGNAKLCGELQLAGCPKNELKKREISRAFKLMIPLLSGLLGLVLIMSLLIINRLRKTKREPFPESSPTMDLFLKVPYESLSIAIGGFSSDNLIGSGGFGSVYKGILEPHETVVAVKVLYLRECGGLKSFMAECEALRSIRHRNLVKILTACSSVDDENKEFKALVYEFMPNGSLEGWLHPISDSKEATDDLRILSLLQRLSMAIDVASALDYLHNHCHQPIVHCDLKSSNILLDNDMTAHVGDFGLARFVPETIHRPQPYESSSTEMKGTIGYAAPDPIVLSSGGGADKDKFTTECDSMLQNKVDQLQECLISVLNIGLACSVEFPRERMEIGDVLKELQLIKGILLASRMTYSSMSQSTKFEGSSSRSATSNWQNVLRNAFEHQWMYRFIQLDLSKNNSCGRVPEEVLSLPSLSFLLDLTNLGLLDISENRPSGEIPSSFGSFITLVRLFMAGNIFEGNIPSSLSSLRGLENLDISRNKLSGQIPKIVKEFFIFKKLEPCGIKLAGNINLRGAVPELKLPTCSVVNSFTENALCTQNSGTVTCDTCLTNREERMASSKNLLLNVTYHMLFEATDGFSKEI
ncbi:LOW QUALITY PROTEIN: hypothetical protein RJ639_005384 [Escallonia herrerae]|uniref:non-specific serine/threonine protein kinase n=1 Tax=Escallonia herrerae TaxID=1293975 RepID=A0AA88VWU4_9ASTE|nr:LOW QUALITY PROTEIN: hypothetical protein RJ639_005384 [Escallonia herrerae]